MIKIYTDASVSDNKVKENKAGCAFAILNECDQLIYENYIGYKNLTNNRAELYSVIHSLEYVREMLYHIKDVLIFTDSQYIVQPINGGWIPAWIKRGWIKKDGEAVANSDLWVKLVSLWNQNTKVRWVRGHSTNEWNNYVNDLSRSYLSEEGENEFGPQI